ncbi:16S rRNA (guanine(527)-N(7))-methyltransferase RsmG [Bacillaceae bacterium Marseille-Q3522]|nr:16S rRNA (guanine(527)-N(7))-methyltransferase RsmG [Bacillaceae bacterium Marseille-Q3522]
MNKEQFISAVEERGIHLSLQQLNQFERYFETLIEWNEKMNLTAITDKAEVYVKHFFDSLTACFYYDFNRPLHLCDVGAGAGFPSIPIKIAYPELQVTIVDSLKKRISFLEHTASVLQLDRVHFLHDRAENFGQSKQYRESFDIVTARAVARMSVLSELCLPLVKIGGSFIAMKGANANTELAQSKKAIQTFGGELAQQYSFTLPIEESERHIFIIKKVKKTANKYPRKPGTPSKEPIE